jgi:hypothetical protein
MTLLLDIDGVMVPAKSWEKPEILDDQFMNFSHQASIALQMIISKTNSNILLTTSHKDQFDLNEWINIFNRRNISVKNIDKLPRNIHLLNRKDEILNWYNSNPGIQVRKDFIILDDDKSLNALPIFLKERLVLTNSMVGLTVSIANEVIKMMNRPKKDLIGV